MISYEWGKERELFMTSVTYPSSFVYTLTFLTPTHFCTCSNSGSRFPTSILRSRLYVRVDTLPTWGKHLHGKKDIQHYGQNKQDNDLQNNTQKSKDRVTRTTPKPGEALGCSGRVVTPWRYYQLVKDTYY
jgi:hypothetical protein